MTTITVSLTRAATSVTPAVAFAGTEVTVVDNSGAKLLGQLLTGKETPPWTAVFTGAAGPNKATATLQDLDITGAGIGNPIVVTEGGTGGVVLPPPPVASFFPVTGATITVV